MKLSFVIFQFYLVFLMGCKSDSTAHTSVAATTKLVTMEESYRVIYKSQMSSKKVKEYQIITSNEALSNLVSEMNIDPKDYQVFLNIDFKKYNLLAYYLGEKPSGGYDIVLQEVKESETHYVFNHFYNKSAKEVKNGDLVEGYDVVFLAKTNITRVSTTDIMKEVRFSLKKAGLMK